MEKLFSTLIIILISTIANADPSATCARVKGSMSKMAICSEEAMEAQGIDCSKGADALKELDPIHKKCSEKVKGKLAAAKQDREDKKASSTAPAKTYQCKAIDLGDHSIIAEAETPKFMDCMKEVRAKVVTAKCTADIKTYKYNLVGMSGKPIPSTAWCHKKP